MTKLETLRAQLTDLNTAIDARVASGDSSMPFALLDAIERAENLARKIRRIERAEGK